MQTLRESQGTASWLVQHPCTTEDGAAIASLRATVEGNKGKLQGVAGRATFDQIMEHVAAAAGVVYEADTVGGVPGWWCRPEDPRAGQVVMHIHGGWFNWGSARAYGPLAGHLAASTGVAAFVPEYRLAPEHPFPCAAKDVQACYFGLIERGFSKVAITGDSAGGNLALELLIDLANRTVSGSEALVGGVALSPVTDLALSGESWSTRAVADPYFTKPQAAELVRSYLGGHEPEDSFASPLYADLKGLAPIRLHVGSDEVLLDDSVRLVERAVAAGVDARLHLWQGMVHGHLGSIGQLAASNATLEMVAKFLLDRFATAGK